MFWGFGGFFCVVDLFVLVFGYICLVCFGCLLFVNPVEQRKVVLILFKDFSEIENRNFDYTELQRNIA